MQKQKLDEEQQINLVAAEDFCDQASGSPVVESQPAVSGANEPSVADQQAISAEQDCPAVAFSSPGELKETSPEGLGSLIDGRYELISLIGTGGMGKVYKALDQMSQAVIAIKIITPERVKDPKALERFKQEARIASGLSHPNIAPVREFGQDKAGSAYLVMDYIEGITVSELLRRDGALSAEKAIKLTVQVCDGLKQAHDRGIVHRDLKPSNIILVNAEEGEDRVKILDFGIARALEQVASGHIPLTETGELLGTPWYMSPEQCFGQLTDRRTDVYQLGCFLYELLTGKKPFEGTNAFDIMFKHVTGTPGLEELSSDIRAIVEKTLNKNPDERYQSMDELINDLQVAASNCASTKRNREQAAGYGNMVSRPTGSLETTILRRLGAGAVDSVIIASTFTLMLICIYAAKLLPQYSLWDAWPSAFFHLVDAFRFAALDSFLVWPSALLSVLPDQLLFGHGGLSTYLSFLHSLDFGSKAIPFVMCLVNWLYHALFECSKLGATPGKIIFGLGVRTGVSQTVSFRKATQRHFAKALSMLLFPELIRFFGGLLKRGLGSARKQLANQLRTPLHDTVSKCAIGINASKARKATIAVLVTLTFLLSLPGLPWAATYFHNYNLALLVDSNFAVAREQRASQYLRQGKVKDALADLAIAQKLSPEREEIYAKEAALLYQLHDFGAAVSVLQNGIKNCEKSQDAVERLKAAQARILAIAAGDYKAALELLQQLPARMVDPILKAYLLEQLGDSSGAKAQFKVADDFFRDEPDYYSQHTTKEYAKEMEHQRPDIYQNHAMVASILGQTENALEYSKRAISDCKYVENIYPRHSPRYVEGSAYLLQGQLKEKSGDKDASQSDFKHAVVSFTKCINSQGRIESQAAYKDGLYQMQKLGQAYLGRAKAHEKLGKHDLALSDRASARKAGVIFDCQCKVEKY
jgi:tetratricopeptide (TPR) repeat protein/uncharacterized RDD family membrane protein YckC